MTKINCLCLLVPVFLCWLPRNMAVISNSQLKTMSSLASNLTIVAAKMNYKCHDTECNQLELKLLLTLSDTTQTQLFKFDLVRQNVFLSALAMNLTALKCMFTRYNPDFGIKSFLRNNFTFKEQIAVAHFCPNSPNKNYTIQFLKDMELFHLYSVNRTHAVVQKKKFQIRQGTHLLSNDVQDDDISYRDKDIQSWIQKSDLNVQIIRDNVKHPPKNRPVSLPSIEQVLSQNATLYHFIRSYPHLPMYKSHQFVPYLKVTIVNVDQRIQDKQLEWQFSMFVRVYLVDLVLRRLGMRAVVTKYCEYIKRLSNNIVEEISIIEKFVACQGTNLRFVLSEQLTKHKESIVRHLNAKTGIRLGQYTATYADSIEDFDLAFALTFIKRLIFGDVLHGRKRVFEGGADILRIKHPFTKQATLFSNLQWNPIMYTIVKSMRPLHSDMLSPPEHYRWIEEYPLCGDGILHPSTEECECSQFGCYFFDQVSQTVKPHNCCDKADCTLTR